MAIGGLGVGTGLFDRASAAGDPPAGARVLDDSPCPPGHNTPLPLRRSPPVSFKRLLGGRLRRSGTAQCVVLWLCLGRVPDANAGICKDVMDGLMSTAEVHC